MFLIAEIIWYQLFLFTYISQNAQQNFGQWQSASIVECLIADIGQFSCCTQCLQFLLGPMNHFGYFGTVGGPCRYRFNSNRFPQCFDILSLVRVNMTVEKTNKHIKKVIKKRRQQSNKGLCGYSYHRCLWDVLVFINTQHIDTMQLLSHWSTKNLFLFNIR